MAKVRARAEEVLAVVAGTCATVAEVCAAVEEEGPTAAESETADTEKAALTVAAKFWSAVQAPQWARGTVVARTLLMELFSHGESVVREAGENCQFKRIGKWVAE